MVLKRPLSPHLQVYKIQITTLFSISHRASGVLLFFGLLIYSWYFILHVFFASALSFFSSSFVGKVFSFFFLFSLIYHFLNGIRHLLWDLGANLSNQGVITSSVIVSLLFLLFNFLSVFFIFFS